MQRMTEARDEYVADALTNMQPHCEDLACRRHPIEVTSFYGLYLEHLNNHINPYPNIIESRKLAIQRTNDRHDKEKIKYDNKHRKPHFDTGDLVLVKAYHHPNSGKLVPYFTGPYKITEIISDNVVRINRPNRITGNDSDTVHTEYLGPSINENNTSLKQVRIALQNAWDTTLQKHAQIPPFPFSTLASHYTFSQ
ncbi:hypothetical protein LAZ67_8002591 [Cordylochernes scorpioides]|uniref:Uncharacterized protein n=1 Tax=Cordylochernes scorpioides TaxID=51811 RepID=A0ABY6KRJ8_9ARAC|nr:hypothetical protein LAZ67_8002591 [Cordylochernes scorpioides]